MHAELFTRLGSTDFAACPYHQADDWTATITETVLGYARARAEQQAVG
ncbi:hypothetical protein [Streptomyces clavuligerus]|nr:hypothetical protein [Streptomyces clavuligerus]EDY52710.1 hypothetical protein SSCG_05738 [Streptomyces clavuligerus]WDN55882.1 hypothetical protein LL058_28710 [Streptomyces clavuligerus]